MKTKFAAIMLILCIITTQTVAFAVNDSQAKELQGVWTCALADGISTLTFNEDGTASLVVGNATYKCTYSLNGNTLNLTQNGSTITASYTNDTISFVLAGQHLVFSRDAFEPTDLIGTWECGLADSVSTLTINSDGTASMVVGGSTYKVTYTVIGNTINLTQNGSTITGTCDSNTISLTFAGVHMLFTKKTAAVIADSYVGTWHCYKTVTDGVTHMANGRGTSSVIVLCEDGRAFSSLLPWLADSNEAHAWLENDGTVLIYQPWDTDAEPLLAYLEGEDLVVPYIPNWSADQACYFTKNPDQNTIKECNSALRNAQKFIGELP